MSSHLCARCERAGDLLCATQRLAEKILNIYEQLPFQNDPLVAKVTEITGHLDVLLQKHVTKYVLYFVCCTLFVVLCCTLLYFVSAATESYNMKCFLLDPMKLPA